MAFFKTTPSPTTSPTKPALRLLFTFLTTRDVLLLLVPAVLCSIAVGMIPTAMSKVVGKAFDEFTLYNPTSQPAHLIPHSINHHFLHEILTVVYLLIGLAAGTFIISTISVSAWICLGERTAARVRSALFASVMAKKFAWYDTGMGLKSTNDQDGEEDEDDDVEISPAGLMTKVARECDDVRVAVSRELGDVVQHVTTAIASLVLALYTSWSLTLVILASIPVVLIMTIVTEIGGAPWLQRERISTAHATSMVERVVEAINTVKAFNAQKKETNRFQAELKNGSRSYRRMLLWWAVRYGSTGGLVFATFVQGFWYGSYLVSKGKITPGQVMTVFMSSLLVSSTLNDIVQALTYIDKGKIGAANLINLMKSSDDPSRLHNSDKTKEQRSSQMTSSVRSSEYHDDKAAPASAASGRATSPLSEASFAAASMLDVLEYDVRRAKAVPMSIGDIPTTPSPGILSPDKLTYRAKPLPHGSRITKRAVQGLRRIAPTTCQGEVHLRGVSFSYPSRPDACVLKDVDLYFPPAEMTYVVGGSGSGKSTVAHLLLRLYEPSSGTIQIDDQTIEYLDPHWCRQHIGAVSQDPIIFDMNVHDNVALGLVGKHDASVQVDADTGVPIVPRESIESSCRLALLHDFVRDLPDGYETMLGARGTALSGGQRQRLAIARARLRDPSILILDEATSALDPTTRHLVHEAIKTWRKGKTTIIITHDLSQIQHEDFLYLLENGHVVQQGYRSDLEARDGLFRQMSMQQSQGQDESQQGQMRGKSQEEEEVLDQVGRMEQTHDESFSRSRRRKHRSLLGWEREGGLLSEHFSLIISQKMDSGPSHLKPLRLAERQAMHTYYEDAEALKATGSTASKRRARNAAVERKRWDASPQDFNTSDANTAKAAQVALDQATEIARSRVPTAREVWSILWRTIPSRALLLVGLTLCVMAGSLTPVFSYLLAQLLSTMGRPDQSGAVLKWSLLVLLVALLEGIFGFTRYLLMECLADEWLLRLRGCSYRNVVAQDRSWFDRPNNSAARICQSIVKDADDARNLVGQIIGQLALITSMISLGIIWAMVMGWKLTLAGVAFGPVFLIATFLQSRVISFYEARNKLKREAVSERFHSMVSHIRSIRSMGIETVFDRMYQFAVADAQRHGMRSSIFSGFGHGMSEALTYIAEALIFFVGAKLMISGEYDFKRMMQVFNLIIFAVTFAAQMLTFLPGLSKSMKALADLDLLLQLSDPKVIRTEANGQLTSDIKGGIEFHDVGFAYDGRASVRVLDGVQFKVCPGECVAIVGGSGCGKSTIAALLQRFYEPGSGSILVDGTPISELSTSWLREHISVVGQNPSLFDMSIAENIAYGANSKIYEEAPVDDKQRRGEVAEAEMAMVEQSARAANAHSFVEALPAGYETSVGGGAGCKLSGGQAQRLAIARALMRVRAPILILDECTSALDVANQQLIVETLLSPNAEVRKRRMTTLVITHNLEMMRKCDRILVLKQGKVVEQGSYDALVATVGGYFASLTRGGEWTG
ncbi:related to STE6 - ABC transporter [Ustilago trichophora]|uniref:Related to STE6 - ABC transporter n=1 Tax=Ustilago trichophora TaxID=86804 RepID=A0A5C3EM58_9BASI|nr:related to STE6 - ABC transporter [Ustilago trichophora]